MNHHLNLYRFFNEPNTHEFLENNLSRALSLSLMNSTLFLNEFIKAIVSEEDFSYLFSHLTSDAVFSIDVQVDISKIQNESFRRVYAVALTSNKNIDLTDFFDLKQTTVNNITDVVITIKDIVFVIEVKRTDEDCKLQLFNQVNPFIIRQTTEKLEVVPVCLSWHKIVTMMERSNNLEKLTFKETPFLKDFLNLAEIRYPNWFEPKPFHNLNFSDRWGSSEHYYLMQRLKQALVASRYALLSYTDRLGVVAPFKWASEIIPNFYHYNDRDAKDYIVFNIWPGNTKTQGYHIYNKSLNWVNKNNILIGNTTYNLNIIHNIKICHFNKYITGINFTNNDLIKPLHTAGNFYNNSGLWNIDSWAKFESLLDSHFKPEFKWREKCEYENEFIKTDRTYFTMSLGFEVNAFIPYQEFRDIDKKDEDILKVADKINEIVKAFESLLN